MTIKIEAGQTHTVAGYPFVRCVANLADDEGCGYQTEGWRPGCTLETDENAGGYFPEKHYVADGAGSMVLDVVATFKPGRFPERVFYTRRWIDPDGREFGKTSTLRVATTGQFRRLLKGYRHPFEVCERPRRPATAPTSSRSSSGCADTRRPKSSGTTAASTRAGRIPSMSGARGGHRRLKECRNERSKTRA